MAKAEGKPRVAKEKKEKKEAKPKVKKDPDAPKRALSAYMFFSKDARAATKEENPDATFGELGKLLGAAWKEMDDDAKKPFQDQADQDKIRYETAKAEYEAKPKKKAKKEEEDEEEEEDDDE